MATPVDVLEAEVMNLGQADRTRILEQLIVSIDESIEIEADWIKEALRRKAAVADGSMKMVPGDEAIARLEALFPGRTA